MRGTPVGVTYSIAGRYNYEFIGGPDLKPDLSPQVNNSCHTDLMAAIRVQEYLCQTANVASVMTYAEYELFTKEVMSSSFDRAKHSRYAFLGSILPFIRTAMRFTPQILKAGSAMYGVGRDIHAAMREDTAVKRRAMQSTKMPSRGPLANISFQPKDKAEPPLPEV